MEQVRFASQERVDVPDANALGSTVSSEFRRFFAAQFGYELNGVIRGFEVEPENPVSSRVVIRMDRTADAIPGLPDSLALGVENLGGGIFDYGVLVGGRNSVGELEGPAQIIVDFAGQANGVYTVQMRYATVQGKNENRAFWNEGTNSEFVAATDTRFLPTWEVRITGAPSEEWITLADVTWNGGTISSSDITDLRFLIHEGFSTAIVPGKSGFRYLDQNFASLFLFDFNHDHDRGTFGVGIPGIYQAVWALQRQILDLKGQNDGGTFDWYSRPFHPPGADRTTWLSKSKTLRTVDTITYTIADGTNEWGDFNGPASLEECLAFVSTFSATLPRRIKIIHKLRNLGTQFFTNPVTLFDKDVEIIHNVGNGLADIVSPSALDNHGQMFIQNNAGDLTYMLSLFGRCSLTLRNIVTSEPANDAGAFLCEGYVDIDNCMIKGPQSLSNVSALACLSEQTLIRNSEFHGVVLIGGFDADSLDSLVGGRVRNCYFQRSVLRLRTVVDTSGLLAPDVVPVTAQNLTFEECQFYSRTSFNVSDPANPFGCIDARGARNIAFYKCKMFHHGDEDCLRLGTLPSLGTDVLGYNFYIAKNQFSAPFPGTHPFAGGVGGVSGTGHHILGAADGVVIGNLGTRIRNIHIEDNQFGACNSVDFACMFFTDVSDLWICDNKISGLNDIIIGLNYGILLTSPVDRCTNVHIESNYIGDHNDPLAWFNAIFADGVRGLHIIDNHISKFETDQITTGPTAGVALTISNGFLAKVIDNTFEGWLDTVAPAVTPNCFSIGGVQSGLEIRGNHFFQCGSSNIIGQAAAVLSDVSVKDNTFLVPTGANFNYCIDFSAVTTNVRTYVNGNNWNYSGVLHNAVHLGPNTVGSFLDNHFKDGRIAHSTLAGGTNADLVGYGAAHAAAPTNRVGNYI